MATGRGHWRHVGHVWGHRPPGGHPWGLEDTGRDTDTAMTRVWHLGAVQQEGDGPRQGCSRGLGAPDEEIDQGHVEAGGAQGTPLDAGVPSLQRRQNRVPRGGWALLQEHVSFCPGYLGVPPPMHPPLTSCRRIWASTKASRSSTRRSSSRSPGLGRTWDVWIP